VAFSPSIAWVVTFLNGDTYSFVVSYTNSVRCVR
jgi:hypothetical protein